MVSVNLTEDCSLLGKTETGATRPVHAFKGIPYAAPPTEERRFQPTQPVQLWKGEREALQYGEFHVPVHHYLVEGGY